MINPPRVDATHHRLAVHLTTVQVSASAPYPASFKGRSRALAHATQRLRKAEYADGSDEGDLTLRLEMQSGDVIRLRAASLAIV
jgi:hypothetical protein